MDITQAIIILVTGVAMVIATLVMLNRSWGDFSSRPPPLPPPLPPTPPLEDDAPALPTPTTETPPPEGRIRIPPDQAMIYQAALRAYNEQSAVGQYLVREGEELYIDLDRVADPQQRMALAQVAEVLNRRGFLSIQHTMALFWQMQQRNKTEQ
ncbi:MAG: hypothetical protein MUD01_16875 [Chloroflexaceae bacterium]|jgi:hypothetical protein|nr:hypothetical protein [Chloroflexaceae bacterium]